jgi:hypothetical protein
MLIWRKIARIEGPRVPFGMQFHFSIFTHRLFWKMGREEYGDVWRCWCDKL